jgi:hypothetical protein
MNKKPKYSLIELWGPIRAAMEENLSFSKINRVVASAAFNMFKISFLSQQKGGGKFDTKATLLKHIDYVFGDEMSNDKKEKFLRIVVEEACNLSMEFASYLNEKLNRLGWQYIEGKLIPIELLESYDLKSVPDSSRPDLAKAAARFLDGDLTGAITSACGAVESACAEIYKLKNLGNISNDKSFQTKVIKAIKANGKLDKIRSNLISLGWDSKDAKQIYENLSKSLNQAAFVMQSLRSRMGDVHGSKESLKPIVYDSIKWAMIITSILT